MEPFQRDFSSSKTSDAPLNLSLKTSTSASNSNDVFQSSASKIPAEYYACKLDRFTLGANPTIFYFKATTPAL
jgi:hypothetical protein